MLLAALRLKRYFDARLAVDGLGRLLLKYWKCFEMPEVA
jgi:hypothetical protein